MRKLLRAITTILLGEAVTFEDMHSVNWLDSYSN